MLGEKFPHRFIYILFLSVLAFGMSTGRVFMSITSIGLAVNWLLEGKFNEKLTRLRSLKFGPLVFLLVYLVHVVWLIFSDDKSIASKDLVLKLPLLCFPIVFGTIRILSRKEWFIVISSFITGLLVSCSFGYFKYLQDSNMDYRDLSVFISHIRLSLMLGIGILLNISGLVFLKDRRKWLLLFPILYFIGFIRILQSGTGYIALGTAIIIGLLIIVYQLKSKKTYRIIQYGLLALLLICIASLVITINDVTKIKDQADLNNLPEFTPNGTKYHHEPSMVSTENGYYLWLFQCKEECFNAWNKRSTISLESTDSDGHLMYGNLIRYITSQGKPKNYQSVMDLSDQEIKDIENGKNTIAEPRYGLGGRVQEVLYEYNSMRDRLDPNGHSIVQRILYTQAGIQLIKNKPFFGHTKGDEMDAYKAHYGNIDSVLNEKHRLRSHNQIISFIVCFGFFGFAIIIFGIIYPFIVLKPNLLAVAIIPFIFLGLITDDLLNTQAGVTFFSFMICFLLFLTNRGHIYGKSIST